VLVNYTHDICRPPAAVAIIFISFGFNNLNGWGLGFAGAGAPFAISGLSPAPVMIVVGIFLLQLFIRRCRQVAAAGGTPLLDLRVAMGAGVGLFVGFIGLKSGGIIVASDATFITLGDLRQPEPFLAALGFLVIAILSIRRVHGAIIIGIIGITAIALGSGLVQYQGLVAAPPSMAPIFLQLDILGALDVAMTSVIIAFLFVNLFDTAGTLLGVANRAGLVNPDGSIRNLDRALKADSTSSVFGAFLGCAPVTSYVESAAGVAAGGRTGLTAVTVGSLFLVAIFFAPLAAMVPAFATAGALIYVAMLMLTSLQGLLWEDMTEVVPALLTVVMIPLTFSIANGIAVGFISYVAIKLFVGRRKDISNGAWFLALIFIAKFALM
jgi:AGZA family xanthine/uracil permease-like MFS transporter